MPKVTKSSDGKGDAVVNTETGEETATFDDVLRPVFSPLGVAELSGKKAEYRKVGFANPHRTMTGARARCFRDPPPPPPTRDVRLVFFPVSAAGVFRAPERLRRVAVNASHSRYHPFANLNR